jgi:hypothetical protein
MSIKLARKDRQNTTKSTQGQYGKSALKRRQEDYHWIAVRIYFRVRITITHKLESVLGSVSDLIIFIPHILEHFEIMQPAPKITVSDLNLSQSLRLTYPG